MNRRLLLLAICLLFFFGYLLYRELNPTSDSKASIAALKKSERDVQRKKAKSLVWEDAKAGQGFEYYDSVLTAGDSHALLEFHDGKTIEMGPDSLVVLEPPVETGDEFKLDLKKGRATVKLKKGEKFETKDKRISAKEEAVVKLSSDQPNENTISIENKTQENLDPKSSPNSVSTNQQKISPEKPPEVAITSLSEPPVENTQVMSHSSEKKETTESGSKASAPSLGPPKIRKKYQTFKIKSFYKPKSDSLWAKILSFLLPLAHAEGPSTNPELEWEALPGATKYEIEVAQDKEFKNIVMTKTTEKNILIWENKTSGIFYWRVRGVDAASVPGEFSETAAFQIIVVPKLEVEEPPQVFTVTEPSPEIPKKVEIPKAALAEKAPRPEIQPPTPSPTPDTVAENPVKPPEAPEVEPTPRPLTPYEITLKPHLFYSELDGTDSSSGQTAKFYSNLNSGVDLKVTKNFNEKWAGAFHYGVTTQSFFVPSNKALSQSTQLDSNFGFEAQDRISRKLSVSFAADDAQEIFFNSSSFFNLSLDSIFIPELSVRGNYDLIRLKSWTLGSGLGASALLPGVSSAYAIGWGTRYYGTIYVSRDVGWVHSLLGISYIRQNQSTSSATQLEQTLDLSLSLSVGF